MTAPTASTVTESDPDRTARAITGKADVAVRAPTAELRQGVITAVDVAAARVDLALGGDTTAIPLVAHLSNYRPTVGDTCWVLVNGPDMLALDRAGAFGPSVVSTVGAAFTATFERRSSTAYGDLATAGPAVTVSVSPAGRLLVQTAAWMDGDNIAPVEDYGGGMTFVLSGVNTRSASDDDRAMVFLSSAHSARGTVAASKIVMLTGLNPGSTTVTCKYRNMVSDGSGNGAFSDRYLWALPL